MDFKLIYLARRNPSVRAEDWPRTWRSHAVFVSQFPPVAASVASLFYCSRVREPMLNGAPFNPPGTASIMMARRSFQALPKTPSSVPKCPPRIAPRSIRMSFVCSAPTRRISPSTARSWLVHGGAAGQAAVIRFLARKAGSSREAFFAHWSGRHKDHREAGRRCRPHRDPLCARRRHGAAPPRTTRSMPLPNLVREHGSCRAFVRRRGCSLPRSQIYRRSAI